MSEQPKPARRAIEPEDGAGSTGAQPQANAGDPYGDPGDAQAYSASAQTSQSHASRGITDDASDQTSSAAEEAGLATDLGLSEDAPVKKRGARRALIVTLVVLLSVIVLAGVGIGYYLLRLNGALNDLQRDPTLLPSTSTVEQADNDAMTFVIMGSDSRSTDASEGRSDVLMVAYLSGDRQNLYLISFPRDMWVDIPGYGQAKINAAYSYGGPSLTVSTLESLTGVAMDHAIVMDFEGFIELTTTLGGVTVYNPNASSNDGYDFPQGTITLEGEQALVYVRERYDLPNGDLDRAARQRAVLTAIIDKVASREVLTNPNTFGDTLDQIAGTMTVDEGLTNSEIWNIGSSLRFTGSEGVRSLQAPISGFGTSADGQSIDVVDTEGLAELSQAMANDTMDEYWQAHK